MKSKEILMKAQDSFLKRSEDLYNKISHTSNRSDSLLYLYFSIGFICFCVAIYYASARRKYDVDEIEAFHTAWKISVGERIYEDFFQHHHPLLYYLLRPRHKTRRRVPSDPLRLAEVICVRGFRSYDGYGVSPRPKDIRRKDGTRIEQFFCFRSHSFIKKGNGNQAGRLADSPRARLVLSAHYPYDG